MAGITGIPRIPGIAGMAMITRTPGILGRWDGWDP